MLDQKQHEAAKKFLIKNKTYTIAAYLFAGVGFFVFIALYMKYINDDPMNFVHNPILILLLASPFLPSVWLFNLAGRAKRRVEKLVEDNRATAPEEVAEH